MKILIPSHCITTCVKRTVDKFIKVSLNLENFLTLNLQIDWYSDILMQHINLNNERIRLHAILGSFLDDHSRFWLFLLQRQISFICFHLGDMWENKMLHCALDLFEKKSGDKKHPCVFIKLGKMSLNSYNGQEKLDVWSYCLLNLQYMYQLCTKPHINFFQTYRDKA